MKEYFEWCGGKTHVGIIRPFLHEDLYRPFTTESAMRKAPSFVSYADRQIAIFSDDYIKKMADSISAINESLKDKRNEMVSQMLRKQTEDVSKRMVERLNAYLTPYSPVAYQLG